MAELTASGRRLCLELERARDLAGLSGREMARRIGISQPVASRIGRGKNLPSLPVVEAWLTETGVDAGTRDRVLALAQAAHAETRTWATLLAAEGHARGEIRDLDIAATRIRNVQPTVLPGMLQTVTYARAVLERGRTVDVDAAVQLRRGRQRLLDDPSREFAFVLTEGVLRWEPVPGALAGQIERIASLAELPNVNIGVLEETVDPGVTLWHNFVIRDPIDPLESTKVSIELQHGSADITDPGSVTLYAEVWDRLWSAAVVGEDAIALLRSMR